MMCYKDQTYCSSKVETHTCGREFTEKDHEDAVRWWGGGNYPLALSKLCEEDITKTDKQMIDEDCPEHGSSELAKEAFWEKPLTAHWSCKCKKSPTKTDKQ